MRIIFSAIIFLSSAFAVADTNLGQKVDFYTSNGKPQFGVQMVEDQFLMTFSINGRDLVQSNKGVIKIAGQFFDSGSGNAISDVLQLATYANGVVLAGTQAFSLSVQGAAAKKLISLLHNSDLQISVTADDGQTINSFLDLGAYCTSASDHFINLDSGETGCSGH